MSDKKPCGFLFQTYGKVLFHWNTYTLVFLFIPEGNSLSFAQIESWNRNHIYLYVSN